MEKGKCRLCSSSFYRMESVFSYSHGVENAKLLSKYFDIEVTPHDNLSKKICYDCVHFLDDINLKRRKFQLDNKQKILGQDDQLENKSNAANRLIKYDQLEPTQLDKKQPDESYLNIPAWESAKVFQTLSPFQVIAKEQEQSCTTEELMRSSPNLKIRKVRSKTKSLDHYIKSIEPIKELFNERLEARSQHSTSLHEDDEDFIVVEKKLGCCSIEQWHGSSDDNDIKLELNVFVCVVCDKSFNTKRKFQVDACSHGVFTCKKVHESGSLK